MMKLILGVPTLRRYDLLGGMLRSAAAGTRRPDRYHVIDNGGELLAKGRPDWLPPHETATVRYTGETVYVPAPVGIDVPGENLGCARSWNTMAKTLLFNDATALLFAGDDILFGKTTIQEMLAAMEGGADFVTCGPGGFSCFMVRHRLFAKVGYFDEQFWPAYYEDDDFHRRMRLVGGIKEVNVESVTYEHVNRGSQTLASFNREERMAHNKSFEANKDRYIAKWGGLPHHETFDEPYNGIDCA